MTTNDNSYAQTAPETDEAAPAQKSVAEQLSELAERAVTVPIGAGLVVRDDLNSAIRKLHKKYATAAGLEKELTRYQKRGIRARNRFERQVRGQRAKLEQELRHHRKEFEKQSAAAGAKVEELISAAQGLLS